MDSRCVAWLICLCTHRSSHHLDTCCILSSISFIAALDVNEKHGILDWIQNVFSSGWGKVRQYDEEHHTSETVKETMSTVSDKVVGFEREHHLYENMLGGIQSGVQFLLEKVKGTSASNDDRHEERG